MIRIGLPLGAFVLACSGLAYWSRTAPDVEIRPRVPVPLVLPEPPPMDPGHLVPGHGTPADEPASWQQFRGPQRDNVVEDPAIQLPWGSAGPRVLWTIPLGNGHAGAAIAEGRVYVLDHGMQDGREHDMIRCLSLDPGPQGEAQELWRYAYRIDVPPNHGMSRGVPAVGQGCVVTLGPKCHVVCLDARSGERRWHKDIVREYQLQREPQWYAAQCPLIDGERLVLAPGGRVPMTAVAVKTGRTIWETENTLSPPVGKDWKGREVWADMTHSSILPWDYAGRRMYVYAATNGLVAVDATSGEVLWTHKAWRVPTANVPTPVPCGGGRLFLSGGYGAGSLLLEVEERAGRLETREVYRVPQAVFGSTQHTPILYEGGLYAVRPDGRLACLALDTGQLLWEYSERRHRTGAGGPSLIVNGRLLVLQDSAAILSDFAIDPSGKALPREAATYRLSSGTEAWAPMAYAGGRLVLRDEVRMVCLDLRGTSP